jgi:hypothetical protein
MKKRKQKFGKKNLREKKRKRKFSKKISCKILTQNFSGKNSARSLKLKNRPGKRTAHFSCGIHALDFYFAFKANLRVSG